MTLEILVPLIVGFGGTIIAMQFKNSRCIGRIEGEVKGIKQTQDRLAESYLNHLDKK